MNLSFSIAYYPLYEVRNSKAGAGKMQVAVPKHVQ